MLIYASFIYPYTYENRFIVTKKRLQQSDFISQHTIAFLGITRRRSSISETIFMNMLQI